MTQLIWLCDSYKIADDRNSKKMPENIGCLDRNYNWQNTSKEQRYVITKGRIHVSFPVVKVEDDCILYDEDGDIILKLDQYMTRSGEVYRDE